MRYLFRKFTGRGRKSPKGTSEPCLVSDKPDTLELDEKTSNVFKVLESSVDVENCLSSSDKNTFPTNENCEDGDEQSCNSSVPKRNAFVHKRIEDAHDGVEKNDDSPPKFSNKKKSHFTVKRSNFTLNPHSSITQEEIWNHGDCIQIFDKMEIKPSNKETDPGHCPRGLKHFMELSKFSPLPTESIIYTLDEYHYQHKTSPNECYDQVDPKWIPRQVVKDDKGNDIPWRVPTADEALNYLWTKNVELSSDSYVTKEFRANGSTPSMESMTQVSSATCDSKLIPREQDKPDHGLFSTSQYSQCCENFQIPQKPSSNSPCVELKQFLDKFGLSMIHRSSEDTPSNRLRTTIQRPTTSADVNNNPVVPDPSSSSSAESFDTSFRTNNRPTSNPFSPQSQVTSECSYCCPRRHEKTNAENNLKHSSTCRDHHFKENSDVERYGLPKTKIMSVRKHSIASSIKGLDKNPIVEEAEYAVTVLFSDLQTLWISVSDNRRAPLPASGGLLSMLGLCSYIVKNIEGEWQCATVGFSQNRSRLDDSAQSQRLRERLEAATSTENFLRSEVSYLQKEKEVMGKEIKELSLQLAIFRKGSKPTAESVSREASHFSVPRVPSISNSSLGFHFSIDPDQGMQAIKKREDDFKSLMNCVRDRGNEMGSFQSQIEQYDVELAALRQTIDQTNAKKLELERTISKLEEGNKMLTRDKGHFEAILKLVLHEKQSSTSSLHDLFQALISKLNEMGSEIGFEGGLMEGALQIVQEENEKYKLELSNFKNTLSKVAPNCLAGTCQEHAQRLANDKADTILNQKNEEVKRLQSIHDEKYGQLQEVHNLMSQSKAKLEASLADKTRDFNRISEQLSSLKKASQRQQHKMDELKRQNSTLRVDNAEYRNKTKTLTEIAQNLRSTFTEKSNQLLERTRASSDEMAQAQEQSKWFQSQIVSLSDQLAEANERLKTHEKEKKVLAKRLMSAEEERKVVDTRLNELRVALQGGNVLTDALMERNDALKKEISRLRRAKLQNLDVTLAKCHGAEDSDFDVPPSEMGISDVLGFNVRPSQSSLEENHGLNRNHFMTLNSYAEPRIVASSHVSSERNSK